MIAAVSIDSLAKVFGGLRAVDGVSLQVAPGERDVTISLATTLMGIVRPMTCLA